MGKIIAGKTSDITPGKMIKVSMDSIMIISIKFSLMVPLC